MKVILKPSICLWGFIWWLLRVEMTTRATLIPSGRKLSHSCSCHYSTFPEAHHPPSVMSANCVSLSCLGAPLVLHSGTLSSNITVGVESEALQTISVLVGQFSFVARGTYDHMAILCSWLYARPWLLHTRFPQIVRDYWLFNGLMYSTQIGLIQNWSPSWRYWDLVNFLQLEVEFTKTF